MAFRFSILHQDQTSCARLGLLHTPHGTVETPVFMPVGTQATVKTMTPEEVYELGCRLILSNTYHLYLRPGFVLISEAGGLHRFMHWDGPILTDSGGFQVFSLGPLRGYGGRVTFRSHIDGSSIFSVRKKLWRCRWPWVLILPWRRCALSVQPGYALEVLERTTRWARRCLAVHNRGGQAVFGIIGSTYPDLRLESARTH